MKNQTNSIRIKAMDYVRALAIIFMVFTHELGVLMGEENYGTNPISRLLEDSIGTWAHAMFLLIVGMSLLFSIEKRKSQGLDSTKHIAIRGLFLIGVGFFLNILWNLRTFAFIDIFVLDILIIIGLSIILVYLLFKYIPLWGKILIFFVFFALTPILQNIFLYHGPYAYQEYPEDLGGLFVHYITNGMFPIFPCITYVMLGYILGEIFFEIKKEQDTKKENRYLIGLFAISIPLTIFGYLVETNDFLWEFFWNIFHWEDIFILTLYGMSLLFLAIFTAFERITSQDKDYLKLLSEIGVVSLSIFFFDQLIGIIFENFELYPYLPLLISILIVSIGIIFMFILTHLWLKKFRYGPLEWILRKIS